jgi:hypothetical protein
MCSASLVNGLAAQSSQMEPVGRCRMLGFEPISGLKDSTLKRTWWDCKFILFFLSLSDEYMVWSG